MTSKKTVTYLLISLMVLVLSSCISTNKQGKHQSDSSNSNVIQRPTYHASVSIDFDLVHTKLQLTPDWSNMYLPGTAFVTVTPHWKSKNLNNRRKRSYH